MSHNRMVAKDSAAKRKRDRISIEEGKHERGLRGWPLQVVRPFFSCSISKKEEIKKFYVVIG